MIARALARSVGAMRVDAHCALTHRDRLMGAAMALTADRHDAEDLLQDLFEKLLARPRDVCDGAELAYLHTALRNAFLDGRRAAARRPTAPLLADDPGLRDDDGPPEQIIRRDVVHSIQALARQRRDVLLAVDVAGYSYRETAQALGVPVGTVMSRLHRARRDVARAVEPAPHAA